VTTPTEPVRETEPHLHGNLGTLGLFFSMLAYNAPLVVVVGVFPVMIAHGNGIGTPMLFIIGGLILSAFADGVIRMAKALPRPGAFYSYITAGLGRQIGLGSGFLMLASYFCVAVGTIVLGGIVLEELVTETLHGPEAPWYVWAAVFWAATAVLGYFRVDVSAKVMTVVLALELAVVAVYDLGVLVHGGGPAGLSAAPLNPSNLFDGSFAVGLLLAMGMFGGWEVGVLFREELRRPDYSIPRATYGVIATAGIVYTITAWLFISGVGVDSVVAAVTGDPTGTMNSSLEQFGGKFVRDSVNVLINTSSFAVLLCAHNVATRYAFNLSADGILPRALSKVHSRHGSPYVASVALSAASLVAFIPALLGAEPFIFYGATAGLAALGGLSVFFATTIAIARYTRRTEQGESFVRRTVLPAVAAIGIGVTLILAVANFSVLTGGSAALSVGLIVLAVVIFGAGVVLASVYRRTRPTVYSRIGRQ
jgi:amino acid transporter